MIVVPAEIPVNNPVTAIIVPIAVLPLVHNPPEVESKSVVVSPAHKVERPVITAFGFTVIVVVAKHPVGMA